MSDPRISLKDPWIAAVLAFLIPGAGHFYQRRMFKGALYSVCILGTFLCGMSLGSWRCVYMHSEFEGGQGSRLVWGYFAQLGAGLPALPAILQSRRYYNPENLYPSSLDNPITDYACLATLRDVHALETYEISGRVSIDERGEGSFTGELDGDEIALNLAGFAKRREGEFLRLQLAPRVASEPNREMECVVVDSETENRTGSLTFSTPRSFINWFEVPPTDAALGHLHRMGKIFDVAQVFTWIAGLLNILAIWDAFDGPAYGYGDEPEGHDDTDQNKKAGDGSDAKSAPKPDPKQATEKSAPQTA